MLGALHPDCPFAPILLSGRTSGGHPAPCLVHEHPPSQAASSQHCGTQQGLTLCFFFLFFCLFPDPLAPANFTLSSPSASALRASWAATGHGAEGYVVELHDTASSSGAEHTALAGDARSHTFKNLDPGTRYSVAVRATAGPYHTSTPNLTHCTREYDALLAAGCPPLIPSSSQRPYWSSQILPSSPIHTSA